MLYDEYHDKMKRVAALLGKLYSLLPLIIIALVVMLLAASAMFATKGIVVLETDCAEEIVYGESNGYHAIVLWGIPTYEYRRAGEGEGAWTREKPVFPGDYQVRAFGRTSWFTKNYTEVHDFTIHPRKITLLPADTRITYGDNLPKVKADLAKGDKLSCRVAVERYAPSTTAWADLSTLSITDRKGNDRRGCYMIVAAPEVSFTIVPRPLTVTVQDASKVYDGVELSYDGYEISGGKLVKGDRLIAVFNDSITHAGEKKNTPTLRVVNEKGLDMTRLYDFTVRSGRLTVEKRPLVVRTGSATRVYNGEALTCEDFTVSSDTPLLHGHTMSVRSTASLLDCGTAENMLSFSIVDRTQDNCTNDYSLFVEAGTLTVTPREVYIHTDSDTLVYDGTEQSVQTATVENGVGDTVRPTYYPTIRDVGSISNRLVVGFFRGDKDITSNYIIKGYTYGTVTVVKRPITVQIDHAKKPYTGVKQHSTAFTVLSNPFGLARGHTMTLMTSGSVLFGQTPVHYKADSAVITDAEGKYVTDQYDISVLSGSLTVVPRPITVSTPDAEKMYDGKPLSDNTYSITAGSILVGHRFDVTVDASITDAGSVPNAVRSVRITEVESGKDVSMYYDVTLDEGTLTVRPIPITIETPGGEWMYDGTAHYGKLVYTHTEGELMKGHTMAIATLTPVAATDAGVVKNAVYVSIFEGEREQTHNYDISYRFGDLVVHKRPILVRFSDITWEYDGTPHGDSRCVSAYDGVNTLPLVNGHQLTVRTEKMIRYTDVGTYTNVQPVDVVDERSGAYKTANYAITYEEGTATITKRPLHIRLMGEKYYDGKPLADWYVEYLRGTSPASGHTVHARHAGAPTDAGRVASIIEDFTITDAGGKDVTKNYSVTKGTGTFAVLPRPISIQTADARKPYDGTPLTAPEAFTTHEYYDLVGGHRLRLTVTGSATEIGEYPNTFDETSVAILDASGKDISSNYYVKSITEGTLTVQYPCTVTVTTGSASKDYDGLPLFCDDYAVEITDGELPQGFGVYVDVTGSVTRPGSVPNTATVVVRDPEGKDVTHLIPLKIRPGVLTVRETAAEDAVFGLVYAEKSGLVYLRMASYGDYNGRSWSMATPYDKTLNGGYSLNFLPSAVIGNLGFSASTTLRFSDMGMGMLPYYMSMSAGNPAVGSDTLYTGIRETEYSVTYYPVSNVEELVAGFNRFPDALKPYLLGSYANAEMAYREFVYSQYLTVDKETAAYMSEIIAAEGLNPADEAIISAVAKYIRNAAVYDLNYDPKLDGAPNVAIAFLRDYQRGVCVHYATAATLLFRTLGIPARYVTGFAQNLTAGEWVEIASPGHAWVEVYVDGLGWIPVEVTGSTEGPDIPTPPVVDPDTPELLLIPAYRHKVYDGSYLYGGDELVLTPELEALLAKGYSYTVTIAGAQREIGRGESHVTDFTLYDPDRNDVTALFRIVKQTGCLQVTAPAVRILLYPYAKTMDGYDATWGEGDYEVLSLPDGVTLHDFSLCLPVTEVGYYTLADINALSDGAATYRLIQDGRDVTDEYEVVFALPEGMEETPTLTVSPRAIELTAASETRVDDGQPLTNATVYLSKGSLMEGHTLEAVAVGVQKGVGSSSNRVDTASVVIRDKSGQDVTRYYSIKTVNGQLTLVEKN